ncbi:DHA2 family multidrug resistance protein-like MFS transporter [Pseudomonas duriflava]|uniref:DHA2 family multidrug resistance protein-like MFS transporter n=2 Tax=Pseudomonas duriflava TaxID=459528 RepID=A0A562PJB9_9PSED|nr:DHA2 family multidrug resistance protein-like MFS transporter [Pseudomonas duriflava]
MRRRSPWSVRWPMPTSPSAWPTSNGNCRVLLTGLAVFGFASLLAAFAPTPSMLIGARALLALGGSMIMPCVLGIIRRIFEDESERVMALALWGIVGAAGAALGPLIGGALLEHFWWGSAFLINVPIMLVVVPLVFLLLSRTEQTTPSSWALGQALLLIAGMLALVYGIKASVGATQPILAGVIMAVVATGALAGVELTLAQELQYVLGRTPLQASIFMIPIMAAAVVGGPIASYLSNLCGLRLVASASLGLSAVALAFLALADFRQPGFGVPAMLALLGLTLSIGLTASSIAIMGSVDASKGAAAGALEATGYELGTGLGITLFGMFMSNIFSRMISLPSGF